MSNEKSFYENKAVRLEIQLSGHEASLISDFLLETAINFRRYGKIQMSKHAAWLQNRICKKLITSGGVR
jgi:hypothetical protein